jgi:hypothetical protein
MIDGVAGGWAESGDVTENRSTMDNVTKAATAAAVYRYLQARAWFREAKLPRTSAGPRVSPENLAQDLAQGRRLLADGVLVYPQASPPVVGDDIDPDFLAAITGRDDAIDIDADQLQKLRIYVLRGGDLPRRKA